MFTGAAHQRSSAMRPACREDEESDVISRRLMALGVPLTMIGTLALSACGSDNNNSSSGSKPTYKIAYQGPLSGGNQALGINMDRGVKLAIKQANAKGDLPFT